MEIKTLLLAGLFATGLFLTYSLTKSEPSLKSHFTSYAQQFGKSYSSPAEADYRYAIFAQKVKKIAQHNAKNLSYKLGLNQFSDLTFEEFKQYYLSPIVLDNTDSLKESGPVQKGKKDWREKGVVSPVKDQGQCGSCWAFSAVGALEAVYAIKGQSSNKAVQQFAEQELVDCSGEQGNEGCNGGLMTYAYEYIKAHKIAKEEDYKYTARDGTCKPDTKKARFGVKGYKLLEKNDVDSLIKSLDASPVAVAIEVQDDFMDYSTGVYEPQDQCGDGLNHGVLAVGYDTTAAKPFFIVKNSWSQKWGDKGYIKMAVGTGRGTCGIANKWDAIPTL